MSAVSRLGRIKKELETDVEWTPLSESDTDWLIRIAAAADRFLEAYEISLRAQEMWEEMPVGKGSRYETLRNILGEEE